MRNLAGDQVLVFSAGSHPAGYVHPLALAIMAEIGIDISQQESKSLAELLPRTFDYVVTVCGSAQEACPTLRGQIATYHWPLEDPAMVADSEEARKKAREVRDLLRMRLTELLLSWGQKPRN